MPGSLVNLPARSIGSERFCVGITLLPGTTAGMPVGSPILAVSDATVSDEGALGTSPKFPASEARDTGPVPLSSAEAVAAEPIATVVASVFAEDSLPIAAGATPGFNGPALLMELTLML